jgi:Ca2+-binding EF-hand superfamily protein
LEWEENNENFSRMTTQLNHVRKRFGTRSNNRRPDSKEEKMISKMYQKKSQPEVPGDLKTQFGGVTPSLLLASHKNDNWMRRRKMLSKTENNRKHVEFAKNLFLSWDDDGAGELDSNEIIRPLISMGLSSDSKFANKLLHALDTSNKKKKSDLKLTMLDFIKIFKSDKFSEQISEIISREIQDDSLAKISIHHAKSFIAPTPEPYASKRGKRNITIAMKTEDKGIIEFPINSHMDGTISVYKRQKTNNGFVKSRKTFKVSDETQTLIEENHERRNEEDNSEIHCLIFRAHRECRRH